MNSLSLSELNDLIGDVLRSELDNTYWVRAEIASLSTRGGHGYIDLIEKGDTGLIDAKVRATCWSNLYPMLNAYFQEETGSALQVGMQVLVEVEVNYHNVYGLSVNIVNIDPSYTIGDLAKQRQQTILKLQQEGIFDLQKGLILPILVRRLAIISSEQAAGYEDFIHQLKESGFAFQTTLFAATMQGDNAESSLVEALQTIYRQQEQFDAVVIIRGGGASVDLSCFDSYNLCCHCAQFPLPILTGIGHTRDISILDMVVHTALKTPTAVAAFLIERFTFQKERLEQLRMRLKQTADRQIMLRRHKIELIRQALAMLSPERIYQKGYSLLTANGKIIRSTQDVQRGQELVTHLQDGSVTSIAQ